MEAAKDATNAVKNTVYAVTTQKGDAKPLSGEDTSRQKAADKELEKEENVKTSWTGAPNVAADNSTPPTERAKSLIDNLSKLGPTPTQEAP